MIKPAQVAYTLHLTVPKPLEDCGQRADTVKDHLK